VINSLYQKTNCTMSSQEMQAFVTLATDDTYCLGATVLALSLRRVNTKHKLVVMITDRVSQSMRSQLDSLFDEIITVNVLDSNDETNLALLSRPDLGITFTKLHCWRLTQYSKCVFLDADTLVLHNVDELFEREELSACPDVGWPDCFNSGVFVYRPNLETYQSLVEFSLKQGSFDGGDQGLLNMFFNTWSHKDISKHLPFTYNVVSSTFYFYAPAFKKYGMNTKIVHFIGAKKPWHHEYSSTSSQPTIQNIGESAYLQFWWDLFMEHVHPKLNQSEMHSYMDIDKQLLTQMEVVDRRQEVLMSKLNISPVYTSEQLAGRHRQYAWEEGFVDYHGLDSFSLIQDHIQSVIDSPVAHSSEVSSPKKSESSKDTKIYY